MQRIPQVTTVVLCAVLFWAAKLFAAGDKINTSYISTAPGSSTVIQVAKDARMFEKHGLDATVIFISGSVRGIQAILAGELVTNGTSPKGRRCSKASAPRYRIFSRPSNAT